ncbi:MAG: hypothetical protein Q9227_007247 [Pyrenula ochraceoflavens]
MLSSILWSTYLFTTLLVTLPTHALNFNDFIKTTPTLTASTNLTLTWNTNSSDPDTANLEFRNGSSHLPLFSNVDLSRKYIVVEKPFAVLANGGHGKFAFMGQTSGHPIALTPMFEMQDDGTVVQVNGSVPIIDAPSPIPSDTGSSDSSSSSGLSASAAAGIGVGVALAFAIAAIAAFWWFQKYRRNARKAADMEAALKLASSTPSSGGSMYSRYSQSHYSHSRGPSTEESNPHPNFWPTSASAPAPYPYASHPNADQRHGFSFGGELDGTHVSPPAEILDERRAELAPGETGVPHIRVHPDPDEEDDERDDLTRTTTEEAYELSGRQMGVNGRPYSPGQI